jgi:hypothetical protein
MYRNAIQISGGAKKVPLDPPGDESRNCRSRLELGRNGFLVKKDQ